LAKYRENLKWVSHWRSQDIIVEIKALISLENVHLAQTKNYLNAFNKPTGLLINFGAPSLQFKKIFNSKGTP
jgi:GxxExxY protein